LFPARLRRRQAHVENAHRVVIQRAEDGIEKTDADCCRQRCRSRAWPSEQCPGNLVIEERFRLIAVEEGVFSVDYDRWRVDVGCGFVQKEETIS